MAFKLPLEIETPGQLFGCQFEVERYAGWFRESQVHQKVQAPALEEPSLTDLTLMVIKAWQGSKAITGDTLDELVHELAGIKLPVLHITLAAIPSPVLKKQLVGWVRTNCHPEALVEFVSDSTLGGGVVIRTPDHIYDHSFRGKLIEGRGNLAKVIANV